jgi:hypothetical protein
LDGYFLMGDSWNGDRVLAAIEDGLAKGMDEAGDIAVQSARSVLGAGGAGPSPRGTPPHRHTGALQAAQTAEVERHGDEVELRVGVSASSQVVVYARKLHRSRPWLAQSVERARPALLSAIADGAKEAIR